MRENSQQEHVCGALLRTVLGEHKETTPYVRYWHGYRVVLEPLSAALPIWGVRLVTACLIAVACVLLWCALRTYADATVATVFLAAYLGLSDLPFMWRSAPHSISFVFIFAGAWAFASLLRRGSSVSALVIVSAALGSAFNFLDFLVNPPMMPMLIAFLILLSERPNRRRLAALAVFAWFAGYAETWLAKWAIAHVYAGPALGVASNISEALLFRMFGAFNGVDLVPLAATAKAFIRAMNRVGVIIPLAMLIAILRYSVTRAKIDVWKAALLSSPALICVVWFEALSNHTQIHLTPSSRSAALALAIVDLRLARRDAAASLPEGSVSLSLETSPKRASPLRAALVRTRRARLGAARRERQARDRHATPFRKLPWRRRPGFAGRYEPPARRRRRVKRSGNSARSGSAHSPEPLGAGSSRSSKFCASAEAL